MGKEWAGPFFPRGKTDWGEIPACYTGARAWFGLIKKGAYAFSMTRQMKPFRALLKPSTVFQWTDELDRLFHESKEIIIKEMKEGVRLFDPARPTCLATDWSVDGMGFFLMQKYCHCLKKDSCLLSKWLEAVSSW